MKYTSVAEIARELDLSGKIPIQGRTYNELHQSLVFFRSSHYDQYVPTLSSEYPGFEVRLLDWLNNELSDEDKGLMLELATRIIFFAREDFAKLYTSALRGPIYQWIIEVLGLKFDDPALQSKIQTEVEDHTWFTSITDSMPISDFHHINRLGGIDHRPDWRSLSQFGDATKIRKYMASRVDARGRPKPIRRIVILEDFVGSGTQMQMGSGSVSFAAGNLPDIPILLTPLIICPMGALLSRKLSKECPNLTFSPVLEITADQLLSPSSRFDPGSFENIMRTACIRLYPKIVGNNALDPIPYHHLGFGETGALIVLFSNAPANTLPAIQHESDTWEPLFPRSARIR